MPRPKKPINYEEEFQRIEARKLHHQNSIKELEEEYRALKQQQEQEEISQLYSVYKNSGMSIEQLASAVSRMSINTQETA